MRLRRIPQAARCRLLLLDPPIRRTNSHQLSSSLHPPPPLPCLLQGLRLFPAMVIVPTMQIAWTLFGIISGMLYFEE